MADHIELIIVIAFGILILFLAELRELMRQISRTAEEWHRMTAALRRRRDNPKAPAEPGRDASLP